jgi:hypothetical protein
VHVCRNGAACADLVLPHDVSNGAGLATSGDASAYLELDLANEGADGYILGLDYRAQTPVADGDVYAITITSAAADAGAPLVSESLTAKYTHVDNCAGGYDQFRAGPSCVAAEKLGDCEPPSWNHAECACQD